MKDAPFEDFPHVLRSQQFSSQFLNGKLFPLANEMKRVVERRGSKELAGKRLLYLFWEPSTRTRFSFQFAMSYLGGESFGTENAAEFSSAKKGEDLERTIKTFANMRPDVIVLRHPKEESAEEAFKLMGHKVAIINGGDGPGQHPSQALTDVFTIKEMFGAVTGLKVAVVGGLADSRVANSFCYNLAKFGDCMQIYLVSPIASPMKDGVKKYMVDHSVKFSETNDLRAVAPLADVIYQTRAQIERGTTINLDDHSLGYFVVDAEVLSVMKDRAVVMHPMPITEEIPKELRDHPKMIFEKQAENGLYVRMALLKMILAPKA